MEEVKAHSQLRYVAARYVLGLLSSYRLHEEVAGQLLDQGVYTAALGELYSLQDSDVARKAALLFEQALEEFGWQLPSELEAAHDLVAHHVFEVLEGRMSPREGAWEFSTDYTYMRERVLVDQCARAPRFDWIRHADSYHQPHFLDWGDAMTEEEREQYFEGIDFRVLVDADDWLHQHETARIDALAILA